MTKKLEVVRTVNELREIVKEWQSCRGVVGLVPTMGSLHEGHLSLIKTLSQKADKTIASIFVNPKQFGPNEDFSTYPRNEEVDKSLLNSVGCDLLFAPSTDEMYSQNSTTKVSVPGLGDLLEGTHRSGFFTGVATVVTKLLLQCQPDIAIFGEKDFQQLMVIRKVVKDLNIPVEILGGSTIREADGLAMSSRNNYLSNEERKIAPMLYKTLQETAKKFQNGENIGSLLSIARQQILTAGFNNIDYLEILNSADLTKITNDQQSARILIAAHIGKTRLIDNLAIN